jgi:hypothetical protein
VERRPIAISSNLPLDEMRQPDSRSPASLPQGSFVMIHLTEIR